MADFNANFSINSNTSLNKLINDATITNKNIEFDTGTFENVNLDNKVVETIDLTSELTTTQKSSTFDNDILDSIINDTNCSIANSATSSILYEESSIVNDTNAVSSDNDFFTYLSSAILSMMDGSSSFDSTIFDNDSSLHVSSTSSFINFNYLFNSKKYKKVVEELGEKGVDVSASAIKKITENESYKVITLNNGIVITAFDSGEIYINYTDETVVRINVDGSRTITYGDRLSLCTSIAKNVITDENGNIQITYIDDTTVYINEDGDVRAYESDASPVSIFATINKSTSQYGGSQMDFRYNNAELLQDELIQSIIKSYWPDATEEEMELLLYKICNIGCGYTAMVNTLFCEYEGRENEFDEIFGFPMYIVNSNGEIDFNYEYLILDFFCYIWQDYDIDELYGSVDSGVTDASVSDSTSDGVATGMNSSLYPIFGDFLKKYSEGINFDISDRIQINFDYNEDGTVIGAYNTSDGGWSDVKTWNDFNSLLNDMLNDYNGDQLIISASNYDLYYMDGEINVEDGSGHAMYFIGMTENGDMIVSSWGKEYILSLHDDNLSFGLYFINYN